MVPRLNVSKLDLADMRMATEMPMLERVTVISNHGSVDLPAPLLHGNNHAGETIVAMIITVTEVLHHRGLLVAAETVTVPTGKVVDMVVLQAAELLLGNDNRTTLPLLRVVNMVTADIPDTENRSADMADNKLWELLLVWVAALAVWVPHQA